MNGPAQSVLSLPWPKHKPSPPAEPKQSHDSGCPCRIAETPTPAKVSKDSSYNLQGLYHSLGRAKGTLGKSGCRAVNAPFFCMAFRADPFLMMVFMFANKK